MFQFNTARLGVEVGLCAGLLVASLLGVGYWSHRLKNEGRAEAIQEMTASWNQKLDSISTAATKARQTQRTKYEQDLDSVQRKLGVALGELRKRPSRTDGAKPASGACPAIPACTGDRLAGEDAEFLVRYATGAAVLKGKYDEAYAGFETCRQALERATSGKGDSHESRSPPGLQGP